MIRVRVVFAGVPGTPWLATHYFSGDGTGGEAQLAVDAVRDFWLAVDNFMVNTVSWSTESAVAVMTTSPGTVTGLISTTVRSGAGGTAATLLPGMTNWIVNWRTGSFSGGRELRGKTYVPGPTESDNDTNGVPSGGSRTAIQTAADTLHAVATPSLQVWSRKNGVSSGVIAASVPAKWGSLRSRRD